MTSQLYIALKPARTAYNTFLVWRWRRAIRSGRIRIIEIDT